MIRNQHVIDKLRSGLQLGTKISYRDLDTVIARILETLESSRYTIVPTYLSDEMYNAQLEYSPDLSFNLANKLYVTAVDAHNSLCLKDSDETLDTDKA
jgi:hypothetical protein